MYIYKFIMCEEEIETLGLTPVGRGGKYHSITAEVSSTIYSIISERKCFIYTEKLQQHFQCIELQRWNDRNKHS